VDRLTREQFLKHLRDALGHLYDANRLRQSPLISYFGLAQRFDASTILRGFLIDAITALKPKPTDPAPQRAWRVYESLFCCYVQQLSQQVVADQLAMSARQLRREQQAALEILADHLWETYQPQLDMAPGPSPAGTTPVNAVPDASAAHTFDVDPELAWLRDTPPDRPANLAEDLAVVMELAEPLATQHRVQLNSNISTPAPVPGSPAPPITLAVHPVALHQVLLNLLSVSIPRAAGGRVEMTARLRRSEVVIELAVITTRPATTAQAPISDEDMASLNIAHQLATLSGGRLDIANNPDRPFGATLSLPMLQQLPVLVVDDNADALRLLQRYADGTRYRIVGTQNPEQALSVAEGLMPQVIVLDVMMPQLDGWEVLGRLRQHPATGQVPIVVCTILPQEKLALSLGASAFLRKPVTRQAFLAALDQQFVRSATTRG
jgi:CheY-like chemotaxis protein